MSKFIKIAERIFALACISLVVLMQITFALPCFTYAETAGDVLIIRVQYYGEAGNKIREKVRFSRNELSAMGAETHYYSNVTSVGTVMSLAARGPKVLTIIEKAGIDLISVQSFTFRTIDGYTRNFNVQTHLNQMKYYYPNLSSKYERDEDENMTLLDGATNGQKPVPAILALECGESKAPGKHAEDIEMNTSKAFRFCMGQSELREGQEVDLVNDVTSVDSCHSIYGIDITLSGSPDEEGVDVDDNSEIGSKDNKRRGQDNKSKAGSFYDDLDKNVVEKHTKKSYIKTREIVLGDKIIEEEKIAPQISALNDVEPYSKGAGVAVGIGTGSLFGFGAITRIVKFHKKF